MTFRRITRAASSTVLLSFLLLSASCVQYKKVAPAPASEAYFRMEGGGGGGGRDALRTRTEAKLVSGAPQSPPVSPDRKIIRNGSLDILVNNVGDAANKINNVVTSVGGFVEKSAQTNTGGHSASITVRVPADHLDQAISEIKKIATTVDRENIEARDVTRDYIDLDARLRNAQAEEAQYLVILKRAATVKDTLDVTEKLSDVRGRIEQLQGEMKYLTAQIEMSSLEISMRAESEAVVLGTHWRPLRQAKVAASEMLSGLADWADSVIAFFINLPLIILWIASVVALLWVAVRLIRFLWRKLGPKGWRFTFWRARAADTKS